MHPFLTVRGKLDFEFWGEVKLFLFLRKGCAIEGGLGGQYISYGEVVPFPKYFQFEMQHLNIFCLWHNHCHLANL